MALTSPSSRRSLGFCLGASSIQAAELLEIPGKPVQVVRTKVVVHEGDPRQVLEGILSEWDAAGAAAVLFTGRKLRRRLSAESISEPEALEWGLSDRKSTRLNSSHANIS